MSDNTSERAPEDLSNLYCCSNCGTALRSLKGLAVCPRCDTDAIRQMQGQKPRTTGVKDGA